jgi:hypothetical protein
MLVIKEIWHNKNMAAVTINRIYKTGVKDAYRAIFPHILTF